MQTFVIHLGNDYSTFKSYTIWDEKNTQENMVKNKLTYIGMATSLDDAIEKSKSCAKLLYEGDCGYDGVLTNMANICALDPHRVSQMSFWLVLSETKVNQVLWQRAIKNSN